MQSGRQASGQSVRHAGMQVGKQISRQACRHAGRQAGGRQAGRPVGRYVDSLWTNRRHVCIRPLSSTKEGEMSTIQEDELICELSAPHGADRLRDAPFPRAEN